MDQCDKFASAHCLGQAYECSPFLSKGIRI